MVVSKNLFATAIADSLQSAPAGNYETKRAFLITTAQTVRLAVSDASNHRI